MADDGHGLSDIRYRAIAAERELPPKEHRNVRPHLDHPGLTLANVGLWQSGLLPRRAAQDKSAATYSGRGADQRSSSAYSVVCVLEHGEGKPAIEETKLSVQTVDQRVARAKNCSFSCTQLVARSG